MKFQAFSKFTTHAKSVLQRADILASPLEITPNHLAKSLLFERGSLGTELLHKLKGENNFKKQVSPILKTANNFKRDVDLVRLAPETKNILIKAVIAAASFGHSYVGTEHLFFAMTQTDAGQQAIKKILLVAPAAAAQNLQNILKSTSKFKELTSPFVAPKKDETPEEQKTPAIDFFAVDLTSEEQLKRIDPVIGREKEIERLIHILSRRTKNNPVLVGDAGVGKTAIVEGLAKRIAQENVPGVLLNKRIVALDLASLVAGTMYRGEFESRIRQIIDEVRCNPDIILFIDEIHMIVGAGSASGSLDAANILKPALARGEIHCIGATTFEEFRKHIETDLALKRRFRPVFINEPSRDETIILLKGVKSYYEKFHGIKIDQEAIEGAVDFSIRYLHDSKLPDKAIDILDEACAAQKLTRANFENTAQINKLKRRLLNALKIKQRAVLKENFKEAWLAKATEEKLINELKNLELEEKMETQQKILPVVTKDAIAQIVSHTTKIPIEDIKAEAGYDLTKLELKLGENIIGQDEAVSIISKAVRRARSGLTSEKTPLASFLFLGPSGVGKTETAKRLAQILFGDEQSLVRLDMSEFSESFTISRLIGAPAGYVGFRESGQLTEAVRRIPWSLILFDEIEKAHPDVANLLLQILEEGCLTDGAGNKVNFSNTIIVLTSNIAQELFNKDGEMGFDSEQKKNTSTDLRQEIETELKTILRPELINRLNEVIIFNSLTESDIQKIVKLEIEIVAKRLGRKHSLALESTPQVIKHIARESFNPEEGARRVSRVVTKLITDPLTDFLIQKGNKNFRAIRAVVDNEEKIFFEI